MTNFVDEDCAYLDECSNASKSCKICFNFKHFSPFKERKGLNARSLTNKQKKEGMDFENRGTRNYNRAVSFAKDAARRTLASGALQHDLGDMVTEEALTAALAEFKERGSLDSRGQKQITIKKEWLDKNKEEAALMGKDFYFLPFTFKGDDLDYVVMDYNMLLKYVQTVQILLERDRLLTKQINNNVE